MGVEGAHGRNVGEDQAQRGNKCLGQRQREEAEKVVASCGLPVPLSVGKIWLWGYGGLGRNVGGQGRTRCTSEEIR